MENKLYTFPNCSKCIEVKEILKERKISYQEINAGIGNGKKDFLAFYSENKDSIERENNQIIFPIFVSNSKICQGLEKIISSLN